MKHRILLLLLLVLASCGSPRQQDDATADAAGDESPGTLTLTADEAGAMELAYTDATLTIAAKTISVPARVIEDPDRMGAVTALIDGRIERVLLKQGQRAARGQALATVVSMELGDMIADLLRSESSLRTADAAATRMRSLAADDAASKKQLLESEHALEAARAEAAAALQRLRAAGMTMEDIASLRRQPENFEPVLTLRAPISGVVSMRNASIGQPVTRGEILFTLLNEETALVEGSVFEDDFQLLERDQPAMFSTGAIPGREFEGRLTYIAPTLDNESHALPVRCSVPNPTGLLKPNLYGRLDIRTSARDSVIIVPQSAIVYDGSERFLFVHTGEHRFAYRRVETGREFGDNVEIRSGITAGARVVSGGVFHLKSRYKLALMPEEE